MILKCPRCSNVMKYRATTKYLNGNRKTCVYCGKSFLARKAVVRAS